MKFIEIFDAELTDKSGILGFSERQFLIIMARKTNTETNPVISAGAASPSKVRPRRTATTAQSKRSVAAAEKPASPARDSETEITLVVSNISESYAGPSRDEVARLAYLYWLDRGCQNGSAEEDWLRAEQQLRQQ
jgi:hypothetical protein